MNEQNVKTAEAATSDLKKDAASALTVVAPSVNDEGNYDISEVSDFLAVTNRPDYVILKTCEELAELQEKLLKYHLKIPEKKPNLEEILEEIGDVIFRIMSLLKFLNIDDERIDDRIQYKVNKFMEYYHKGLYKDRI